MSMSDPRSPGLLSSVAAPLAEAAKQHQSATPPVKANNRGYLGAFLLSGCCYLAVADDFASYEDNVKLGLILVGGFGLLLLVTALRTRSARDPVAACLAVAVPVGGFVAVLTYAPDLLAMEYVRCFAVSIACANIVRFWLAVRGPGGDAQKIVHRQIAQNEINWRGVKRGR
jgi:hypothetical protein